MRHQPPPDAAMTAAGCFKLTTADGATVWSHARGDLHATRIERGLYSLERAQREHAAQGRLLETWRFRGLRLVDALGLTDPHGVGR